jgi:hypothetical protein
MDASFNDELLISNLSSPLRHVPHQPNTGTATLRQ